MNSIKQMILSSNMYYLYRRLEFIFRYKLRYILLGRKADERIIRKRYKNCFGVEPDLKAPKSMTEKMQWLKLYDRKEFYSVCADKYRVREIVSKYGEDILVPLLFQTEDWRELNPENIKEFPCIVKANNGCGSYKILWDADSVDWKKLRNDAKLWIKNNHYYKSQEFQYKNIPPCFIVEKLLLTENGIPEDFKLHFINGELEFIHCGVKAQGQNYKLTYDKNWEPLDFAWYRIHSGDVYERGAEIYKPESLDRMICIGSDIAKDFPYVRVDFYDIAGQLYFGEITLCHGSGLNKFIPAQYDHIMGKKLVLPELDKKANAHEG